jgi:hypothetical protein
MLLYLHQLLLLCYNLHVYVHVCVTVSRWLDMRTWAICEVQRVARGALARRLARARLRHFVDRGMRQVLLLLLSSVQITTADTATAAALCTTTTA